jgi:hypothetical protein
VTDGYSLFPNNFAVKQHVWEVAGAVVVYNPQEFLRKRTKAEYVDDGVIVKLLNKMCGQADCAVVNIIVELRMVEARHGMVFHPLWPWEKWVNLGGGREHGSASTPNPLALLLHMSFGGGGTGKEILPYQVPVQVWGPLEESSIYCLEEGCNERVAEALVSKFNIVSFVGSCIGEARSFNDGVARGTTFTGARLWQGCFDCAAFQHHAW